MMVGKPAKIFRYIQEARHSQTYRKHFLHQCRIFVCLSSERTPIIVDEVASWPPATQTGQPAVYVCTLRYSSPDLGGGQQIFFKFSLSSDSEKCSQKRMRALTWLHLVPSCFCTCVAKRRVYSTGMRTVFMHQELRNTYIYIYLYLHICPEDTFIMNSLRQEENSDLWPRKFQFQRPIDKIDKVLNPPVPYSFLWSFFCYLKKHQETTTIPLNQQIVQAESSPSTTPSHLRLIASQSIFDSS